MDVATQPGGSQGRARGQAGRGVPPHAQLQRQRITDHNACTPAGEAGHAVGDGGKDIGIFGRQVRGSVQKDVEPGGDVEVGFLQGSGQGKYQGDIIVLAGGDGGSNRDRSRGGNQRVGGNPTGERGIIMDVKFQEVEKGVGDFGDGAIDVLEPKDVSM